MSHEKHAPDVRLAALVARAQERIHELRTDFDTAWQRKDAVAALYAFQCYREALKRHLAIEEAPRSPNPAASLGAPRRHGRIHGLVLNLCLDLLELLARRIWMGGCVDGEIADRLSALDQIVSRHEACEVSEIKAGLDGPVTEDDLVRLEHAFADARMLRASAC